MKSIKQQYIDLREGNMSQANFMRNLRMTLPQYVTNLSSFEDSIRILKNKGILTEADIKMDATEEEETLPNNISTEDEINNEEEIENEETVDDIDVLSIASTGNVEISNRANPKDGFSLGFFEEGMNESYFDSDPTDGDRDFDMEQRMQAEEYYDKGEQAYLEGDLSKAETLYQAALKAGSWLGWTEFDLPPYGGSESINENVSDDDIMKKYNEMFGKNPQTKFADVAKVLNIPEDQVASALQSGAMPKFGLREAKDEKSKWTNTSGKSMYDQFKEIDNLNGHEVAQGIDWEMQCNPEMSKKDIIKKVIKNLKKNPIYYTSWDMSGVEGYEPETMDPKSDNEARQMQPLDKNMGNVVDKKMGMQPVKGIEKPKKDSDKGGEANKTVKNVELMSLIAKTVRGMKKMDATGEKMKKVSVKENKVASTIFDKNANITKGVNSIAKGEEDKTKSLKDKLKELIRREVKEALGIGSGDNVTDVAGHQLD